MLYKDEDNRVYCLSIPEVVKSINEDNKINIHSGKEYSEDFVEYINKYYTVVEKETPQVEDNVSDLVEDMESLKVDSDLDIEDLFADLTMSEEENVNVNIEVQEEEKYQESESDNDEDMVNVSENTVNVTNKKECQVCKKMFITTGAYKTINDKSELVEYCSMECFNK